MRLSSDPAARRRLALLGAGSVAALAGGVVVGAGEDGSSAQSPDPLSSVPIVTPTPAPEQRLSPGRLAGSVVIMRFAGTTAPAYVLEALREGRAAGVILFRDNLPSPASTRRLTRQIQRAARGRAIICTDQEGGAIRNLPWASPLAGQSRTATAAAVTAAAREAARDLRRHGVNVNLAPVADLGGPGPVMRTRAFPGDTAQVARLTAASVRAYRGTGVAPTVKHFPGLGAATGNTDDRAVTIDRSARVIGGTDLQPFRAAISAGAPLVMMSHAVYPALDPSNLASQSRPIVTDLLRRRLGYRGVVVTDSLEAQAARLRSGPATAAVRSLRAGVDLILTTGPGSHIKVYRAVRRLARRDRAFRGRVEQAAGRVSTLRRTLSQ